MRTNGPRRGDLWPHDMVLTVTGDSSPLLDMLWIRQAWDLDPIGAEGNPLSQWFQPRASAAGDGWTSARRSSTACR